MAIKQGLDDYTLVLDGATERSLDVEGDWFSVLECPTGPIYLRFNEGKQISRNQGQGGRVLYTRVGVYSPVAQTVVLALGGGTSTDSRASVTATITAPIDPALNNPALPAVDVAAGTQEQLVAADADMLGVLVGIDSSQPNGVWIGDNAADESVGLFLEPGEKLPVPTRAALYAYNAGASSVTVTLLQLKKA